MTWIFAYPAIALSYGLLYLTMLLLWFPGKAKLPRWSFSLLLALVLGFWTKQLAWPALLSIIGLGVVAYYSQVRHPGGALALMARSFVFFISIGLLIHQMPGFHGLVVLDHVYLSPAAIPYSLYLNFDQALVGIFLLGFGLPLISRKKEVALLLKQMLPKALLIIAILIALSLSLGFVRFDPKLPKCMLLWAVTNLLFACVIEEAFFRGFIQKNLALMFENLRGSSYLALVSASLLFGLAHLAGGRKYFLLATVAGLGYGWVYQATKRIEASILTHFGLNLVHFVFFTYPMLASAI